MLWWVRSCYLCHFVALSLPAKSLIIQRVMMCTNEDGLPVNKVACALADMKHVQPSSLLRSHPLFWLGDVMTARTQFLVEWNCSSILQHVHLLQNHLLQRNQVTVTENMLSKQFYLYFIYAQTITLLMYYCNRSFVCFWGNVSPKHN